MFYNYWNYPLFLWTFLKRIITGKSIPGAKLFIPKYKYNGDYVGIIKINSKEDIPFLEQDHITVVAFRIYWKDGSKSKWSVIESTLPSGTYMFELLEKGSHKGEIIYTKY
jgi:hypothetical protein